MKWELLRALTTVKIGVNVSPNHGYGTRDEFGPVRDGRREYTFPGLVPNFLIAVKEESNL